MMTECLFINRSKARWHSSPGRPAGRGGGSRRARRGGRDRLRAPVAPPAPGESEYRRPETIEETAELVTEAGGTGIAVPTDHLEHAQVKALVDRIRSGHGRLDVLVNDIWGGELLFEWDKPVWDHDLDNGLRLLRLGIDTHLITAHYALPLLIEHPDGLLVEMTDGTADYNARTYRINPFYDLAKVAVNRMGWSHAQDLAKHAATSVSLTPGWLRSEMMLEHFGVREDNWRDALDKVPGFVISESPRFVGRAVAALAADPDKARFNGESLSSGGLAQVYAFDDVDGSRPDCWRFMDDGSPVADVAAYR